MDRVMAQYHFTPVQKPIKKHSVTTTHSSTITIPVCFTLKNQLAIGHVKVFINTINNKLRKLILLRYLSPKPRITNSVTRVIQNKGNG